MSLEEYEASFYVQRQEGFRKKGNIRDQKVWSQRTLGNCLRNCAESNLAENKGPVLGSSKRENQRGSRDRAGGPLNSREWSLF